jgi:glycosyltransferase involved in cell wall biosynthesis
MDTTLLSLISYLMNRPARPVVVFGKTLVPQTLARMSGTVATVIADRAKADSSPSDGVIVENWMATTDWHNVVSERVGGVKGAVAVFVANAHDIPVAALSSLRTLGFSELLYLEYGQWFSLNLSKRNLDLRIRLRRFWDKTQARCNHSLDLAAKYLRKVTLKRHAVDLRNWFPHPYIAEAEYGFRAHIPQLQEAFDTVGITRDEYALFEEEARLYSHQPLIDIRQFGGGACSLWEADVVFSTTDGSDANTNGRRYRLVHLKKCGLLARLSLWMTSRLDVESLRDMTSLAAESAPTQATPTERLPSKVQLTHVGKRLPQPRPIDIWKDDKAISSPRGIELSGYTAGRIVHYVGSLGPGGTERQLTYLATSCQARGLDVSLALPRPAELNADFNLHYKHELEAAGVHVELLDQRSQEVLPAARKFDRDVVRDLCIINSLPPHLREEVAQLYRYLLKTTPQVVHCWLDYANCTGGLAALLAGVPQIVLSFRSVNPTNFPHLHQEWFLPWYQLLLKSERVTMTSNSKEGARSYAGWLGCDERRITVIHNGLDTAAFKVPSSGEVSALRESAGIPSDAPVIAGVFRFTAEKRPLRFLRIVSGVMKRIPELHVLVAGEGPLVRQFKGEMSNLDLSDRVHLLGRRRDVPTIISAADLLLLTSNMEGLPNVLMEAQWFGRPVVAPKVGGIPEVVQDGEGGWLFERNDVERAVDACATLLEDMVQRERMSKKGGEFVRSAFSLPQMIERSVEVYQLQAKQLGLPRIEPGQQTSRVVAGQL